MKTKYIAKRRKVGGFTLLELLVVVGILAIIAGAIITAYDGFAENAARKTAANTVASMTSTIRTAQTTQGTLPTNVETLISAVPATITQDATTGDWGGTTVPTTPTVNTFLSPQLAAKFGATPAPQAITQQHLINLLDAGVDTFRYIDSAADPATQVGNTSAVSYGTNLTATGILDATTMQGIYGPATADLRNMGRGYSFTPARPTVAANNNVTASTLSLMIWGNQAPVPTGTPLANAANFQNVEVGADATAVLVALGVGQQSSLVGGPSANGDTVKLAAAPFYGAVKQNEYNHYIMLIDVTKNPALFVTVVDSRGNNLDQGLNGQ